MSKLIRAGGADKRRGDSLRIKLTVSYSVMLLICLALGVCLYCISSNNARADFWQQRTARLKSDAAVIDNTLAALDSYARQLLNDSTFVRFSNMKDIREKGYLTTASAIKKTLSSRLFSLSHLPIRESHIYLKNVGYVISAFQFTEVRQFYKDYRAFAPDKYDAWLSALLSSGALERNIDTSPFSVLDGQYWLVRDIDAMMGRSVPAIIWFEWDMDALERKYIPADAGDGAALVASDSDGGLQLALGGSRADSELRDALLAAIQSGSAPERLDGMRVLSCASAHNDWRYWMLEPESLCDDYLGNYDLLFALICILAALGGGVVVSALVRRNMRPIKQLGDRLKVAEGDRAQLMEELDTQRPMLCASYLWRVLSGHIASAEEFRYIMRYLRLDGDLRFMVLYAVVYGQHGDDPADMHARLEKRLPGRLQTDYPIYYYTTPGNAYVILVSYNRDTPDPLMDLQKRVIALHDELLEKDSLWLYAGVGRMCEEPSKLWEAYEQARTAARYTAKSHVFLPYEVMSREAAAVYYPVEISAKLQHFITTGNRAQTTELFALIHRENVEERALPVNQLNFLLSDLKNTLLRVRFSIKPQNDEEAATLERVDERLAELPTFAICETAALGLCDMFAESAEPADPIPEIKAYLCDNFTDPSMCLSKLSERYHISESYLSHLFKERTGQNFSVYLEELRLNEATRRLREMGAEGREQRLTGLYAELGYNNATTFRRAFKKRYGVTPSELRDGGTLKPQA